MFAFIYLYCYYCCPAADCCTAVCRLPTRQPTTPRMQVRRKAMLCWRQVQVPARAAATTMVSAAAATPGAMTIALPTVGLHQLRQASRVEARQGRTAHCRRGLRYQLENSRPYRHLLYRNCLISIAEHMHTFQAALLQV